MKARVCKIFEREEGELGRFQRVRRERVFGFQRVRRERKDFRL